MASAFAALRATGAVLAGGKSSRLGRDKALLTVNGETLLVRALRVLADVTIERIVVGPPERVEQSDGVAVVADVVPESGPLGGILTALEAATNERVLVVGCDMPFLNRKLLRHLLGLADGYDVVLPRLGGRGEQLHAVYTRSCRTVVRRQIERETFKVDSFFGEVRVRIVEEHDLRQFDPDLRSFRNVNTPEDWAEAQALLSV